MVYLFFVDCYRFIINIYGLGWGFVEFKIVNFGFLVKMYYFVWVYIIFFGNISFFLKRINIVRLSKNCFFYFDCEYKENF